MDARHLGRHIGRSETGASATNEFLHLTTPTCAILAVIQATTAMPKTSPGAPLGSRYRRSAPARTRQHRGSANSAWKPSTSDCLTLMNLYGRREGPHLQTPMTASQVRDHSTSGSVGEMKPATMPSGVWRDFFLMGAIARSQYLYTAAKPTQQAPTGKEKLADVYIYGARTRTRAHTRHNIRVHVHVSHTRLVRTYRYVCPCCARLISSVTMPLT